MLFDDGKVEIELMTAEMATRLGLHMVRFSMMQRMFVSTSVTGESEYLPVNSF